MAAAEAEHYADYINRKALCEVVCGPAGNQKTGKVAQVLGIQMSCLQTRQTSFPRLPAQAAGWFHGGHSYADLFIVCGCDECKELPRVLEEASYDDQFFEKSRLRKGCVWTCSAFERHAGAPCVRVQASVQGAVHACFHVLCGVN